MFGVGFLQISSIEFADFFFSRTTTLVLSENAIKTLGS
jgi:hypothetical protein